MLSKPKIKLINSLKMGKFRKLHSMFVAEGTTNVIDLLNSNLQVADLFATEKWIEKNRSNINDQAVSSVDTKELKKISFLKHPSDVLAVFKIPDHPVISADSITDIVLMLDDVRDPGNLGTIIRTADWFGIKDIICSNESADAYNPKVVQASMGSLSRVRVHYTGLKEYLISRPEYLKVFSAVLNGEDIVDIPKPQKGIILIGNEAHGVSKELYPFVDQKITIPMVEKSGKKAAESLNASIATAIICYEFRR